MQLRNLQSKFQNTKKNATITTLQFPTLHFQIRAYVHIFQKAEKILNVHVTFTNKRRIDLNN